MTVAKPKANAKPRTVKVGKQPAPRGRVPIALLRTLDAALADGTVAEQCAALHGELGGLAATRSAAIAAAALAHTRKGTPVARAYLTVLADGTAGAADAIVRYCATMELDRSAMRGAFVAAWPKATDVVAIEAAYANFAKAVVGDPLVLAAGVEAARRLGNKSALAERTTALDRATRLAPLVAELSGGGPARARATRQLAALSSDDRRQIHARVIDRPSGLAPGRQHSRRGVRFDRPSSFDAPLAVAAVLALADDPRITDMSLAAAMLEMQDHAQNEVVAAWKTRVAAGDHALVMRLLGLFEWTSLRATDHDQLEPYIHALWPASGHVDVYSHIEHAMASPNVIVRAAVCEEWIRQDEGRRGFSDKQIDKLVRSAVAIAEAGEDAEDQQAANSALFYVSHPGARNALIDAVRHASTKHNDDLRDNLYRGLGHITHADVMPFFIERMFVEREEYWALMESIAERLDVSGHRAVLAQLARRTGDPDAIHAATMYAEVLVDRKPSPRLLVELARAIVAWSPVGNDDARRLRYVFEQATLAAFTIRAVDDARTFVARAKALPASPYSDYRVVDRDTKTPAVFGEAAVKKQLAALETGKLDREIAEARAAAEAARAAGKPIAVDDARLGLLAGCTVASRFLDDRERKVIWFTDEVGELHVYDGYSVVPMVLEVAGVEGRAYAWNDALTPFVAGQTHIDERVTFMDAKSTCARDVIRIGSRLLVFDGRERDDWEHIGVSVVGLRFGSYTTARDAVARFTANPPDGMSRVDSWYREGAGAIRRGYYAPLSSDGEARLAIVGSTIDGPLDSGVPPIERTHAAPEAAIKALQTWEGKLFAAGGRMTRIWLDPSTTRREDTLLSAYFDERYRTDTEGAAWHLRALADIMAAIDEAGLRSIVPDIVVTLGPPATDAELAAYQALVPEPLPEPLVGLWREVGGGGFTSSSTTVRFLSPAELVTKRGALRDQLHTWAPGRLKGRALTELVGAIDHLDVIATLDGAPLILFDTQANDNDSFASADRPSWRSALGRQIGTEINVVLTRELARRVGDIYRLRLGSRVGSATRRVRLTKGEKEYEAIVDGVQLMTRTLTPKRPGKPSVKQLATAEAAARAFDEAVAAAKKKGFR